MHSKQLINWLPLLLLLVLMGCDRDEIDVAANTDFPPSIISASPSADGRVVAGDFDVRVVFADGSVSPLSSATVTLMDSNMTEIKTVTKDLSGIQDSLVIAGSEFDAASLGVGVYNMSISVTDSKGQTTEESYSFEISSLPFPANEESVYIAGAFNGWTPASNQLNLVGPNLWEIQGVDLQGGEWKLVDGPEFGGEDWGDGDCDGFMESNQNGSNENTACGAPSGLVNIRFNDQTLSYTVAPQVTFSSSTMSLYLLGTFNNFSGGDNQLNLIGDNTWELEEIELGPGDQFKFAEMPDFLGTNYGDDDNDGVAQVGGSNIVIADSLEQGFYSITFNDRSLQYEVEFLRATYTSIGIIGTATPLANFDEDVDMTQTSEGVFTLNIELTDGEVKFRADDEWVLNWGGTEFPSGTAVPDGDNIMVTAGTYDVTFDVNNLTYSFEEASGIGSIGILGSALPNGFDSDIDLIEGEDGNWSRVVGLNDGEVKFRADDDWAVNFGGTDFPSGTGTQDGPNIPVTAGIYIVEFNASTGAYSFTPATIGLIGTATPIGDFETDLDMTRTADGFGEVSITTELTEGEAKFRVNDMWDINWGNTDFPTGTGVRNGENIPVAAAGTYTVTFDVNTDAYTFEQ